MKLIEIKGKSKILDDDGSVIDFFNSEEEEKIANHVVDAFFQKNKGSSLMVGSVFRQKVMNEGIDVDCVYTTTTYEPLSGKMGKFAFYRETLKSSDEVAKLFIKLVEANLEFYNKTCIRGFELTMDDVIDHLKRTNIKK